MTGWASREAVPLVTVDPNPAPDDFLALRPSIGDARIVGLGESVHGASELLTLKHRMLRFLVERMGFRSVAWEEDWTTGLEIDRYIRTGEGDVDALVREMSPQWQSQEVADVLRWLRQYNVRHADDVRFFGVEYYFTRRAAYDAVEDYVAEVAPDRLAELRRHLDVIRPFTADEFAYVEWYMEPTGQRAVHPSRPRRPRPAPRPARGPSAEARSRCTTPVRSSPSTSTTTCRWPPATSTARRRRHGTCGGGSAQRPQRCVLGRQPAHRQCP